jgi:hypothetical protein
MVQARLSLSSRTFSFISLLSKESNKGTDWRKNSQVQASVGKMVTEMI